ncbi:MAG: hypothetical protein U0X75_13245 [Acidobacteriota bacterium]
MPVPAGITILKSLKDSKVIKKNAGASLIDLGDGVACVEFHSKMNALGGDQLGMIQWAVKEVENYVWPGHRQSGRVLSAGANIIDDDADGCASRSGTKSTWACASSRTRP